MRWLLVLAVAATLGRPAHAHRPVMQPLIVRACPHAASWELLIQCFKIHDMVGTQVRTLDAARLLSITTVDEPHELEAFAMYLPDSTTGGWRLGGLLQKGGFVPDYEVLRFERAGAAYRIDLGTTLVSSVSLDGVTATPAVYRQISAAFCSGGSYRCTQVVPHCEQIVHGQTITVFEGTLTVRGNVVLVKGVGSDPTCGADVEEAF